MCTVWVCRVPELAPRSLRPLAHALRDQMLGQTLGNDVCVERGPYGKPELVAPSGWHFSLSHSRNVVVLALARSPIGVDVEPRDRQARWRALAQRQFQPDERAILNTLAGVAHEPAALALWTAKEAWAKATGLGVARMAQAPSFEWHDRGWSLPQHHHETLRQFLVWDAMVLSLYGLDAALAEIDWIELSAERDDERWLFAPSGAHPVAEFCL